MSIRKQTEQYGRLARPSARRYYVLVLLTLISTMNFLDRQIMAALIEPIRHELNLSDTQIGFMVGIAFTLMYAGLSIPAARLADRWSRRNVVALAVTVWSAMTIACGMAQNFVQLFLARFGVCFGEAGGTAPSNAIISDLFPREQRATAMSIFVLANPLGMAAGLLVGGWVGAEFGWRTAFVVAGIPGLILGPLLFLTVKEPQRGSADGVRTHASPPPLRRTISTLWSIASLRNMVLAAMLQSLVTVGFSTWMPAYLARSHGLEASVIGTGLAAALGLGLAAGTLMGSRIMDVLGRSDLRWYFWLPTVAVLASAACGIALFLLPTTYVFWLFGLQVMFGAFFAGPFGAIVQNLSPIPVRATASACTLIVVNVVALGLGPQAIGIASDLLRTQFGEQSLESRSWAASS